MSKEYPFTILYSDGTTLTQRGPFKTLQEAVDVFEAAPVMPGQGAYLMEGDQELMYYYERTREDDPEHFRDHFDEE